MRKYLFQLNGEAPSDDFAEELASLDEAKCHAVQMIAETLCHQPMRFWQAEEYKVTVTDVSGLVLFVVEMVASLSPAVAPAAIA